MVDIPGDSTTTATISVGGTVSDTLEVVGDHDWFKINLTAGQSISVLLDGLTLEDAYLRIYDSSGNLLFENDDINPGIVRDSKLAFTADQTGTYYIDVGAWEDDYAGTYQLSVSTYAPPPVATVDEIADQLVNGYWGGDDHHFNVTQGGSITVNLSGLTTAAKTLATAALQTWTDIIGVNFVQVTSGGQIIFDDEDDGAYSDSNWSSGIITSSFVNVSSNWLVDYGTDLTSYSFQTYIHEIGHALGLGHAGNYNGEASFPYDALFYNDSWAMSVMSYFSQTDNSYFAGQSFSENYLITPMMADILAISALYGLSTTTRTGNDTYYGNFVGAMCVFDSGGTDQIYSPWGGDQLINLNPGTFSNLQASVGNLSIAHGVIIENATGGPGNDTIIGNDVDNVLDGGSGNDSITGGLGNDTLISGGGGGILDGGGGIDTAIIGPGPVSANLALGTASSAGASISLVSIENLVGSAENDTLTGSNVANVINGSFGNDTINGADGNDTLDGGAYDDNVNGDGGNDILRGGTGDDTLNGGAGLDRAMYDDATAPVTVNLATGVSTTTNGNWDGVGSDQLSNIENVTGSNFGDIITGNGSANILDGLGGNDTLDGGSGADQLNGGLGDDIYMVDQAGDVVTEAGSAGTDEVRAAIAYALGSNVENLRITGSGSVAGTGNSLANIIRGNDAANLLSGLDGADKLYGNGGDDTLEGGNGDDYLYGLIGNDSLTGGAGYDRMYGGVGDDSYYANDADDYAYEEAGEGQDQVIASVDHQLRVNVENLTLTGSAFIGKGNDLGNSILGTANANRLYGYAGSDSLSGGGGDDYLFGAEGNDTLTGGSGYDRMYGGAGDDLYIVADSTDYAYENVGEGNDRVIASINHQLRAEVEELELAGSANLRGYGNASNNLMLGNSGANLLYGRDGNDTLQGNAGNDILYGENGDDGLVGGSGQDRFYGGAGADVFIFDDGDFAGMASSTSERIHDFVAGLDQIRLGAVDANSGLAGDQAFAFIGNGAFTGVAGQLRFQQISGNTYVQGDTDGDGDADFWVRLDGLHDLEVSDFII